MIERPEEPVFPWNDCISMTSGGSEQRAVVIALSAVFDAIQSLRWELAERSISDSMTEPLVCGFCYQPPEDHSDSDAGPMTVCPAWALAEGRDRSRG